MTLLIGWKVIVALVANLSARCVHTNEEAWCTHDFTHSAPLVTEYDFRFDDLVIP